MKVKETFAVVWIPNKSDRHKNKKEASCFVSDRGTQIKAFAKRENAERFKRKMERWHDKANYKVVKVGALIC